jgi:hypothetical protein
MIRAGYSFIPSLLFLVGCPSGRPSEAVVDRIEARLSKDPCLQNLGNMRRTYSFAKRGWKIDHNRIDIGVEQAGWDGLPKGKYVVEPSRSGVIDERNRVGAAATYVVSIDELDLWHCGGTWSGIRHMPRY